MTPRVLVIYYSLSGQTRGVLQRFIAGLQQGGALVTEARLTPLEPLRFPLGSIPATLRMMVVTLFRRRFPIEPAEEAWFEPHDLIVLGGPTWSYHPSGPVLDLLDRYGNRLFRGRTVLPLISCRGYWRMHWFGLRRLLLACGAEVPNRMIFTHPVGEPWRTLGVFLKLAGRVPERTLGGHYPRYGHSRQQQDEAYAYGVKVAEALAAAVPLEHLDLSSPVAMP
ncbi:MAG: hypothetical protein AB1568_07495 [Thermodesulfobacteriota bacterium]